MDDEYHNILSEEFPSPIREHDPLPPVENEQIPETPLLHVEQAVEQAPAEQTHFASPSLTQQVEAETPIDPALRDEHVEAEQETLHDNVAERVIPEKRAAASPAEEIGDRRRVNERHTFLSEDQKKARQKVQNRKAAEKSRQKKREELATLEVDVNTYTEENARLRARLADLQANQSNHIPAPADTSTSNPAQAALPDQLGVDYTYLGKIQSELIIAKTKLYERELELLKLRGKVLSPEQEEWRAKVLNHHTTIFGLQAEVTSLEGMAAALKKEREEAMRQAEDIGREVETRKALRGVAEHVAQVHQEEERQGQSAEQPPLPGDAQRQEVPQGDRHSESTESPLSVPVRTGGIGVGSGVGVGAHVDKTLMDIGGWVDAAVRDWQTSSLPVGDSDTTIHDSSTLDVEIPESST